MFLPLAAASADDPVSAGPLPFAVLLDTGRPAAAAIPPADLAGREGWKQLDEDVLDHTFAGATVLANDRIAVALRKGADGVELYARSAAGWRARGSLSPRARALSAVAVRENSPAAVEVEATFTSDGGAAARLRLRVTTGQAMVQITPAGGVAHVELADDPRFVLVPDYFADDVVVSAATAGGDRVGLPTENFFLAMAAAGDGLTMCVWEAARQDADVLFAGAGEGRRIAGCRAACVAGKRLWLALLEAPGIWHARRIAAGADVKQAALDWKPPFDAKWRASLAGADGMATSVDFAELAGGAGRAGVAAEDRPRTLVVYPLDRSRGTPLTAFLPIDVLRNTLGVGACQYILDLEGLASDEAATPDAVTHWVQRQFDRGRAAREADAIREQLDRMVAHVGHAEVRIGEYAAFAGRIRELCKAAGAAAAGFDAVAARMQRSAESARGDGRAAADARRLADELLALIGKDNAAVQCQAVGEKLRTLGSAQDRGLAACRMAVRLLRQRSRAADAAPAAEVRARAEQMLYANRKEP